VPYNGPGGIPDWAQLRPERPRVLVAWGTSLTNIYGPKAFLVPMLLSALADLDVDVLVIAKEKDREALGDLPPNARALGRWCPLRLLLPTCDAVVHYGSGGSALTATVAGVPQFALTFAAEQAMNSRRLAAGGSLLHADGATATPELARELIGTLLSDPAYRGAAEALRDQALARPTPVELVDALVEIAGERAASPAPAFAGAAR
jgi:UDP:flavonoid glycosyltransferase YjiC (YdhE family)